MPRQPGAAGRSDIPSARAAATATVAAARAAGQNAIRTQSKTPPKAPTAKKPTQPAPAKPKVIGINVVLDAYRIFAYVLGPRAKEVALREWTLNPAEGGVIRHCHCERGSRCQAHGMILRPMSANSTHAQMVFELEQLAHEYDVLFSKLTFFRVSPLTGQLYEVSEFEAVGAWKDEVIIRLAQETFDQLYRRR